MKTEIHPAKKELGRLLTDSSARAAQNTLLFLTAQVVAGIFSWRRREMLAGVYLRAGYMPWGELEVFVEGAGGL